MEEYRVRQYIQELKILGCLGVFVTAGLTVVVAPHATLVAALAAAMFIIPIWKLQPPSH